MASRRMWPLGLKVTKAFGAGSWVSSPKRDGFKAGMRGQDGNTLGEVMGEEAVG